MTDRAPPPSAETPGSGPPRFSADRTQPSPVVIDGKLYCRICHEGGTLTPNHPEHRLSPYCAAHYKEHRDQARRRWRVKQQQDRRAQFDATVGPGRIALRRDGTVVIPPDTATQLSEDLRAAADALAESVEANRYAVGTDTSGPALVIRSALAQIATGVQPRLLSTQSWLPRRPG